MLEVVNIRKRFGGLQALGGVSLTVPARSVTGLIGVNGSGKTTVMNCINGLHSPDEGDIRFNGKSIARKSPTEIMRLGVGRTFQVPKLFPRLTLVENLLVPMLSSGDSDRALIEKADGLLAEVDLYRLRGNYAQELSGGQQKLVELLRVMMFDPTLILLDEPFAGVHPDLCRLLLDQLEKLAGAGVSFVLVSHDLTSIYRLSHHIVALDGGRLLAEGDAQFIQRHPAVLEAYLGAMTMVTDRPIMALRDVTVAYHGDITILDRLNLEVRPGKVTGIIGPNGAGKSTALKTLYGFLKLRTGERLLDGEVVNDVPAHGLVQRGIAFVPQNRSLFGALSVEDNLLLGCWAFKRDKNRVRRGLERAYTQFPDLAAKRSELAGSMSGGQQRFLELARALVIEPRVVLLDEPTAMIAPKFSKEIYRFIAGLPEQGVTVVLVDQNVRQCAAVSDFMFVLELGRNRLSGDRSTFEGDSELRRLIATWLEYKID